MARGHREGLLSGSTPAAVEQWRAVIARACFPVRRRPQSSNGALS